MILSDQDLRRALGLGARPRGYAPPAPARWGSLVIDPLDDPDVQIQPASIDLRLGPKITRFDPGFGTVKAAEGMKASDLVVEDRSAAGYVTVRRGEFILGHTLERVGLPSNLTGRVEGRSSIGRLGVTMHVTAGYIDPGFEGQITLEIANLSQRDVEIPIGHRVCQIVIETMSSAAVLPYGAKGRGSRYQGQTGATPFLEGRAPCGKCGSPWTYDVVANTWHITHATGCPDKPPRGPAIANTGNRA